jgi:outer membrane receptor protein involved in Fe transport
VPPISRLFPVAFAAVALVTTQVPARADTPTDDAFSMMQEQTVTGVTKRPLPLSEAPSSVTVIPAVEIRAMGYHKLSDALHWVRGLFITYDRAYEYLGVRGMQRPGDYNNRVLVSIDGHTMNGAVYDDAYIGNELGLDLEDVERIEIVRGPGSAVYGSSAVLAVINIVTRKTAGRPPVSATLRAGGASEWLGHVGLATSVPGKPELHASVSWLQAQGRPLYYFDPDVVSSPQRARDGEHAVAFFGGVRWNGFDLTAKLNERRKTLPPASFELVSGSIPSAVWDGRDFVELSTSRPVSAALELSARAYWDGSRYHGRWFSQYEPGVFVQNLDFGDADAIGTEVRGHWAATTWQALTFGVEAQRVVRTRFRDYDTEPYFLYYDVNRTSNLLALYAQDEMRFGSRAILTVGGRLDNDTRYEAVLTPRADLVVTLAPGTRFKLLAGSAFRGPSEFEIFQRTIPGRLAPERVATYEAALERQAGPVLMSLSGYESFLRDLIDLYQVDSLGYTTFTNLSRVRCQGVEAVFRFTPSAGTHARVAAAGQRSYETGSSAELTNSPRWNVHALAYHTLRDGHTTVAGGIRYLSQRISTLVGRSAAYVICDARVAREVPPGIVIGVEARNLFDARYGDPGWGDYLGQEFRQDPRSLYVTFTYPASEAR